MMCKPVWCPLPCVHCIFPSLGNTHPHEWVWPQVSLHLKNRGFRFEMKPCGIMQWLPPKHLSKGFHQSHRYKMLLGDWWGWMVLIQFPRVIWRTFISGSFWFRLIKCSENVIIARVLFWSALGPPHWSILQAKKIILHILIKACQVFSYSRSLDPAQHLAAGSNYY